METDKLTVKENGNCELTECHKANLFFLSSSHKLLNVLILKETW